jgi:universal stress protein A
MTTMKTQSAKAENASGTSTARRRQTTTVRTNSRATAASAPVSASLQIKSILVPIDFSAPSKKALDYAVPFAEQFGAKLTLLHVVEPVATPDFANSFPLMMENDKLMAECKAQLQSLVKQEAIDPKLVEKTLVRQGRSFHEITDAARTLKADLIIISTHGYTGLKHALLGSTAERVVRHAPCPVLVVREREHELVES